MSEAARAAHVPLQAVLGEHTDLHRTPVKDAKPAWMVTAVDGTPLLLVYDRRAVREVDRG